MGVVDFCPGVAGAEVVGLAVVVGHAVVVFDAVGEVELRGFFGDFPPGGDLGGICVRVLWGKSSAGERGILRLTVPLGGFPPQNFVIILYV